MPEERVEEKEKLLEVESSQDYKVSRKLWHNICITISGCTVEVLVVSVAGVVENNG